MGRCGCLGFFDGKPSEEGVFFSDFGDIGGVEKEFEAARGAHIEGEVVLAVGGVSALHGPEPHPRGRRNGADHQHRHHPRHQHPHQHVHQQQHLPSETPLQTTNKYNLWNN